MMNEGQPSPWVSPVGKHLNRWRYRTGTEWNYIEVELTQGKYAVCDLSKFDRMQERKWSAHRKRQKNHDIWYAMTGVYHPTTGKHTTVYMHNYLYPHIGVPIDHIDHNGLNNIEHNLRDGSIGINQRNPRNPSDGVIRRMDSFRVRWTEANGRRESHTFIMPKNGSAEVTHALAKAFYDENSARVFAEKLAMPKPAPVAIEYRPAIIHRAEHQTGVPGLTFETKLDGSIGGVRGSVTVGKRVRKTFGLSKYGNNQEAAIEAGKEWLKKTRAELGYEHAPMDESE